MENILLILMVTMNGYYMINDLIYIYIYWLVVSKTTIPHLQNYT